MHVELTISTQRHSDLDKRVRCFHAATSADGSLASNANEGLLGLTLFGMSSPSFYFEVTTLTKQ